MPKCSVSNCLSVNGHKFPDDPYIQRKWIDALDRNRVAVGDGDHHQRWTPGSRAIVCRAHFTESDYSEFTYDGNKSQRFILKKDAVPSVFNHNHDSGPVPSQCYKHPIPGRPSKRQIRIQNREARRIQKQEEDELARGIAVSNVGDEVDITTSFEKPDIPNTIPHEEPPDPMFHHVSIQAGGKERYTAVTLSSSNMLHYYTGLETYEKFKMVLSSLGPAVQHLRYFHGRPPPIPLEDQLLLTLMKLRRHTPSQELAFMFSLDERQVANTFITWLNFMHCQWSEIDFWPVRELVQYYSPTDFKSKFPQTRVILDGMECPIQKPGSAIAQQATFSSYKNRNTVKAVVGGCPGGLVSYTSPAYGGATSDRQIVERSDLPKKCNPGDQVMVDKGFNVDDLFIPNHVEINIPSFFKKKNRMSCKSIAKDRKIASKRVHIERLIGLGKTYKILTEPMTPQESSLATPIINVIFTLCNFRICIVPDDA